MKKLLELSTSYIKDGKLIKYRYNSDDVNDNDHILSAKAELNQELTTHEYIYLENKGNMVIENKGKYNTINLNDSFFKLLFGNLH